MKKHIAYMLGIASVAATLLTGPVARAQQNPTAKGLDSLDEKDVYTNLIGHKLNDLAKLDMASHKVPAAEQEQMVSLASLSLLKDERLTVSQRRATAVSAANGMQGILPRTEDATVLNDDADTLVNYGVTQMVDNLDYYGPNPEAERQLLPVAQTAKDFYTKASAILDRQINLINGQITSKNMAEMMKKGRTLVDKQLLIDFSNNMTSYAVCISLPAGDAKIVQTANDAIKYLKQFDNATSGVQPEVKIAIGKLDMARGDYAAAKAMLDPVIAGGSAVTPAALPGQQYKARYFAVLCELQAKNLKKAESDVESLDSWQKNNLHMNVGDMTAVQASVAMLHFRIYSAESDAAGAGTDSGKGFNDKAIVTLVKLLQDHPGNSTLEDLVFDQIRGRIGATPVYSSLDTLALLAIQTEGLHQLVAQDTKPADPAVIEKAISASRELVKRKGRAGVDQTLADRSARFIGYAYQFCLHKDYEAADSYLDYLTDFKDDPKKSKNVSDVLTNCESILHDLHGKQIDKSTPTKDLDTINALFDRFLPLVIAAPYNEKQLSFMYAKSLYDKHKWAESATYFEMVGPADPKMPLASYLKMVALDNLLRDPTNKIPDEQRKGAVTQLIDAAKKAAKANSVAADVAGVSPTEKTLNVERMIDATMTASEREMSDLKEPAAALKDLDGVEAKAAPLEADRQNTIHTRAVRDRCLIYLGTDETAKAVAANLDLLKIDRAKGQQLLLEVNDAIDRDLNTAVAAKDKERIKQLTVSRAALTSEIVKFVANDPKMKDLLPEYELYDADSQQNAAEVLDEGPARVAALKAALAQYDVLLKQYAASGDGARLNEVNNQIDKQKTPKGVPEKLVAQQTELQDKFNRNERAACGAGLVSFDLGEYQRCYDLLSPLIDARHVGTPTVKDSTTGATVEYARYWEVYYKYYQSQINLALKNKGDPKAKETLVNVRKLVANEFLFYKESTGGSRWHDQWTELLKQAKDAAK